MRGILRYAHAQAGKHGPVYPRRPYPDISSETEWSSGSLRRCAEVLVLRPNTWIAISCAFCRTRRTQAVGRTSTSAIVCCLGARTNPAPLDSPLAWGGLLLGATPGRLCVHAWTPYVPVRLPAGGTPSADCSLAHGPPKNFGGDQSRASWSPARASVAQNAPHRRRAARVRVSGLGWVRAIFPVDRTRIPRDRVKGDTLWTVARLSAARSRRPRSGRV